MLSGNIAATSLKILWKNPFSVKCYDKSNMNVFTLSLKENFQWGLIYFDQFTYRPMRAAKALVSLCICTDSLEPLLLVYAIKATTCVLA